MNEYTEREKDMRISALEVGAMLEDMRLILNVNKLSYHKMPIYNNSQKSERIFMQIAN